MAKTKKNKVSIPIIHPSKEERESEKGFLTDEEMEDQDMAPIEEEDEEVDLIASGYEWTCPRDNALNHEIEIPTHGVVTCLKCGGEFPINSDVHHARG